MKAFCRSTPLGFEPERYPYRCGSFLLCARSCRCEKEHKSAFEFKSRLEPRKQLLRINAILRDVDHRNHKMLWINRHQWFLEVP